MNSYTLEFQIYRLGNFLPNILLINSRVPESSYPFSIPCAFFHSLYMEPPNVER